MKQIKALVFGLSVVLLSLFFTGCELAAGIFKAGFWTAILAVAVVIGLIIWLVSRAGGGGKS